MWYDLNKKQDHTNPTILSSVRISKDLFFLNEIIRQFKIHRFVFSEKFVSGNAENDQSSKFTKLFFKLKKPVKD